MNTERFETPFFLGLLLLVMGLVFFVFQPELSVLVLGVTLAVLFQPVYLKIQKVMPRRSGIAAFLTVILAIVIILAPLAFFGMRIFQEAEGLYDRFLSGGTAPFIELVRGKIDQFAPSLAPNIDQYVTQALGVMANSLGAIVSQVAGVAWIFFLGLFVLYYMLKDGGNLQKTIIRVVPLPEKHTGEILKKMQSMATSVVRGSLLVAVGYGIVIGLGFAAFGLPNPVLWGGVSVIAALIPVVGTWLVAIPAIGSLMLSGNVPAAIGFAVWIILMAALMENIVRPRLIGRNAKVHPLLLLLSVIGGLAVFGPMGILLGPLALSLLLALLDIYPTLAFERAEKK